MKTTGLILIALFYSLNGYTQLDTLRLKKLNPDSVKTKPTVIDSSKQKDVEDLLLKIFSNSKTINKKPTDKKLNISIVPFVGYSLTTGIAADLPGNVAFFTSANHDENISVIQGDLSYDIKTQKIFVSRSEIWTNKNHFKLTSDIRWMQFPENTYGIGTATKPNDADPLVFNWVKVYATVYKKIVPRSNYFFGLGYNLDYHYNIKQTVNVNKTITDFDTYGGAAKTTSSGLNLNFLYDTRANGINPLQGTYANVGITQNLSILGSNSNWESIQLDFRKYLKVSRYSNNVLAIWAFVWLTKGNPPYLDLPYTGGDTFNNTGRGYIQGRFTGKNMLYIETEYRFGILKNGLLGGVVFTNAESLTEYPSNSFKYVAPAAGAGIRIKINKHSNTNVAIDYGYGIYHSHGLFVNLGEVF